MANEQSVIQSILSIYDTTAYLALTGGNLTDDSPLGLGTGGPATILWETADGNANALLVSLPTGGAVDVPLIIIGQGVTNVDPGLYNGVVDPRIAMFGVGAVTTAPVWEFRKARGTFTAPTAITTGDDVGSLNAYVCVANGEWVQSARILFDSEGTIATTRGPGAIVLYTATDAAPSVLTEALRLSSAQKMKIKGNVWLDADPNVLYVRNAADTAGGALNVATLAIQNSLAGNDGFAFATVDSDAGYAVFKARDTGVGLVEVGRLVGAADPYFQITLAMRLNPIATASLPATPVEGMLVYDDTANKLKMYNGSAWETVTSAVV